jgi:acetyl/propionyl-CoA carboxylase alpha subunit
MWDKVKANTQQLTREYEGMQQQLQQLHIQQLQQNRQFELQVQQLPQMQASHTRAEKVQEERKQQQQQNQHHLLEMLPPPPRQQQQQQELSSATGDGSAFLQQQQQHLAGQQQEQQQEQQQSSPAILASQSSAGSGPVGAASPAAAAAAAATAGGHSGVSVMGQQSPGTTAWGGVGVTDSGSSFAVTPGRHSSKLLEAEEVLLQVGRLTHIEAEEVHTEADAVLLQMCLLTQCRWGVWVVSVGD